MTDVTGITLEKRGTHLAELTMLDQVRICNYCGHAPASHFRPVKRFRQGCQEEGCSCPYSGRALEAMDYVADAQQERAEAEFWCENCQEAADEPDTRYECGNCGSEFGLADEGSHRCPDCGKFAAKVSDNACPTCGEEL